MDGVGPSGPAWIRLVLFAAKSVAPEGVRRMSGAARTAVYVCIHFVDIVCEVLGVSGWPLSRSPEDGVSKIGLTLQSSDLCGTERSSSLARVSEALAQRPQSVPPSRPTVAPVPKCSRLLPVRERPYPGTVSTRRLPPTE